MNQPLTYETHRKIVPTYHIFIVGILAINVLVQLWGIVSALRAGTDLLSALWEFLVACALVLLGLYVRMFPLRVQDRVIRLEQQRRLLQILPEAMHPHIDALSVPHLIAIRFASDDEAAELVEYCVANPRASQDDVKKRIKIWIADQHRI